ncbi:MAG TPA: RNA polymerase sigma factor [Polyangiaceae bacterium]|nr:RNA polymerase sigma factor [Polyangiaceae bacterium]
MVRENAARSGKAARPAFAQIFSESFDYVWFSLRRLGVRERDVEDLTHEVFLRIHGQLDRYDPERPLRPWLFAFAYRVASDYRKLARHRLESLEASPEATDASVSAFDVLATREASNLAQAALGELDVERRAIFLLHEVDGCTMPEIADALQIPLNTAYSRLRLAREQLARALVRLRSRRGDR